MGWYRKTRCALGLHHWAEGQLEKKRDGRRKVVYCAWCLMVKKIVRGGTSG